MSADFLRRIKKKADVRSLFSRLWSNKKLSATLAAALVILLYVLFNNQGVLQRVRLEREKKAMLQKIQQAEQEQKQLQDIRINDSFDAEFTTVLLTDLLYAQFQEDRTYEIKYDTSRLTTSQIEIIEEYVRLLQLRSSNPDSIKLRPFSSASSLIHD